MSALKWLDLPPIWLAGGMVLVAMMAAVWAPLGDSVVSLGWAMIVFGLGVAIWAVRTLVRAGTTAVPHQQPDQLVTDGPFAYSRNPIYLADLVILAGWCLVQGTAAGLVLVGGLYAVLELRFVRPEEARLRAAFGRAFDAYCAGVRRWV